MWDLEKNNKKIAACKARLCTSKTLGLEVMKIKVNFFVNNTPFRRSNGAISLQSKEGGNGLCVKCNEGKTLCDR